MEHEIDASAAEQEETLSPAEIRQLNELLSKHWPEIGQLIKALQDEVMELWTKHNALSDYVLTLRPPQVKEEPARVFVPAPGDPTPGAN